MLSSKPPLSKLVLNTVVGFDYKIKFLPLPFPVNIHSLWLPVKHLSKPILAETNYIAQKFFICETQGAVPDVTTPSGKPNSPSAN